MLEFNYDLGIKSMLTYKQKLGVNLTVAYGILEYVVGFSAEKGWEARGIAGNFEKSNKLREERIKRIRDLLGSALAKKRLESIVQESLELFDAFIYMKEKKVDYYLKDKEFYFIVGCSRTGGTYLMKELSKALDWCMTELLETIIHDNMPYSKFIRDELMIGDIGWRRPKNYYNLLFQVCQFLVYINREASDKRYIVKKKEYFALCLSFLENIFGEKANYLVTVRHPAAIDYSRKENFPHVNKDEFERREKSIYLWEFIYSEVARDRITKGKITPVLYGANMDKFLRDFFEEHNYSGKVEGIKIAKRKYDYNYWKQTEIINRMRKVENLWDANDLEFPLPKEIL